MAKVTIAKADNVTATWGAITIENVQSVTVGDQTLEPATMFAFFTGTGKNAQAAGSNFEVQDSSVTGTLDTDTWANLTLGRATGCAAHVPADLVIVVCYAGQTATMTIADMVFAGKTGLTIGKNAEIPAVFPFQHQDLDGSGGENVTFVVT